MSNARRSHRSAIWAGIALTAGMLVACPTVMLASASSAATCTLSPPQQLGSCDVSGQATVAGGSLSIGAPATVSWTRTLTGFDQYVESTFTLQAIDATGSGTGWSVTASATPMTHRTPASGLPTGKRMHKPFYISRATSSLTGQSAKEPPDVDCGGTSECTPPSSSTVSYPVSVPICAGTGSTCTPSTVAAADATTGMGAIDYSMGLWLGIPANAYAGLYTNTITFTISSGP
jgi:hypothetical protein